MSLYIRGLSRTNLLNTKHTLYRISNLNWTRYVLTKAKPVMKPCFENYEEKNTRLGRPLSPHVNIYALKFSTLLSLSHRISGMILSGSVVLFVFGVFLLHPFGYMSLVDFADDLETPEVIFYGMKLILSLTFSYHYVNGIRHTVWDFTGNFIHKSYVNQTGYIVVAGTLLFTALLMALGISRRPDRLAAQEWAPISHGARTQEPLTVDDAQITEVEQKTEKDDKSKLVTKAVDKSKLLNENESDNKSKLTHGTETDEKLKQPNIPKETEKEENETTKTTPEPLPKLPRKLL